MQLDHQGKTAEHKKWTCIKVKVKQMKTTMKIVENIQLKYIIDPKSSAHERFYFLKFKMITFSPYITWPN